MAGCHRRQGTEGRWKTGDMSVARFDWSNFRKTRSKGLHFGNREREPEGGVRDVGVKFVDLFSAIST